MHTLLQGGVFISEVEAILISASHLLSRQQIQDFLRDESWQFPHSKKSKNKQLHRIFDEKRRSATDPSKVKCSCSEALGVYGMLRFLLETNIGTADDVLLQLDSFRKLCRVLDATRVFIHGCTSAVCATYSVTD